MTPEMMLAALDIEDAPEEVISAATGKKRNLGGAVVLAAIDDYRGVHDAAHRDAGRFLYPRNAAWQAHFDWVVAMADGMNGPWLRDALNRMRDEWDRERQRKLTNRRVRCSR